MRSFLLPCTNAQIERTKYMLRLSFICIGLVVTFSGWPLYKFPILLAGTINITPVIFLIFIHAGLFILFKRVLYQIGLALAALLALATIFLGGTLGVVIGYMIEWFGSSEALIITQDNEFTLLDKFIGILTYIPFLIVCVLSIPFQKLETALIGRDKRNRLGNVYVIIFFRVIEHVIYVVLPRTLLFLKEEKAPLTLRQCKEKSVFQGLLVGVAIECIISAFEYLPSWVDELSALRSTKNA